MTDFETHPVGTGKRIEELVATCEELEAKLKTSEEIGRAFEEDAGQLLEKLAEAVDELQTIDDVIEARFELFTSDLDLLGNLQDRLRNTLAALKGQDDE